MADIRDTQNRVGNAFAAGRGEEEDEGIMSNGNAKSRFRTAEQDAARKNNWKRYQFEATASDDEMENELDNNLDEIGEAAKRLKNLGLAMNSELDGQMDRLGRIENKVGKLDQRIYTNTEKVRESSLHLRYHRRSDFSSSSKKSSSGPRFISFIRVPPFSINCNHHVFRPAL